MSKYKCVIFDCDGVLVDSEPISNQVMANMANENGANIDLDYALRNFKGGSLYKCIENIETLINNKLPQTFEKEYRERSNKAFKKYIKPIDGVKDLISSLNIPFCVASSGPRHKIELNLSLTGLLPLFKDNIFSCYDINKWKPDPAVFLWAAKTMGFKPEECVVIEDSLSGVTAALNGGFDVFAFTAHDYNNQLDKISATTFSNMAALKSLIS